MRVFANLPPAFPKPLVPSRRKNLPQVVERVVHAPRLDRPAAVHAGAVARVVHDPLDVTHEALAERSLALGEHLAAHGVDRLALAVDDAVGVERARAVRGVEILNLALDGRQLVVHDFAVQRRVVVHAGPVPDRGGRPPGAVHAHQVVLHGEAEDRGPGVALPSRAAAQLVIDAARIVNRRADDLQPADFANQPRFVRALRLAIKQDIRRRLPQRVHHRVRAALLLLFSPRGELGVRARRAAARQSLGVLDGARHQLRDGFGRHRQRLVRFGDDAR